MLPVGKKVKNKRSPRKPRLRLGPDRQPDDPNAAAALMVDLTHLAEASGELVVDLPPRDAPQASLAMTPAIRHRQASSNCCDGDQLPLALQVSGPLFRAPLAARIVAVLSREDIGQTELRRVHDCDHKNTWRHPIVDELELLASEFVAFARKHANAAAAAAGHVTLALYMAIDQNDPEALNAPHAWARRYLRQTGNEDMMLAVEDSEGRLLDITSQLSGGFRRLSQAIELAIELTRAKGIPLNSPPFDAHIAWVMAYSFPSIPTLSKGQDASTDEDGLHRAGREEGIASSISSLLKLRGDQRRNESADKAAPDIAQELLEHELTASGKTLAEIRAAFHFRNHHRNR